MLDPLDQAILSDWVTENRSDKLGVSCLKTEAEPAPETYCYSVYICYTTDEIQEKKATSVCYTRPSEPYSAEQHFVGHNSISFT